MSETLLDLRGMRCPWPALRVARAIREAGPDATAILAVADDPIAPREITAVATERGWAATPKITQIGPGLRLSANVR
ncbi:sulfurtransferase TusA family protein [Sphingomonas sp. CGMCC 1.13654]|uniref:Sulfurtransferase TusA family protein n=1 Tax=Sphingomonas chungangi TaxID=2683589 RepID=A0A838L4A9_9SPHN|nr:sulfurtransferase TusA family protein [Sphingomonas chungangi]MBA2933392.1 sulfurtransferase TusA family protein [Sphingomonas chungangi]MVW54726.1 sulfurtransferase TusA family protein [Sphingomonas chungangi]